MDDIINKISDLYESTLDCCKSIGNLVYDVICDGYYPTITKNKLKDIHDVPNLIAVIREIMLYDKQYVCDRTLTKLIDGLESINQNLYTLDSCSLIYHFAYKTRNGLSERDSAFTLKVILINRDDQTIISLEEPCYSWLFKRIYYRDDRGCKSEDTICVGNTYK